MGSASLCLLFRQFCHNLLSVEATMTTASGSDIPTGAGSGASRSRSVAAAKQGLARSPSRVTAKTTSDPILRNALRYTMSTNEYAALHKYVLSKSRLIKRNVPTVATVERILDGREKMSPCVGREKKDSGAALLDNGHGADTHNARAVRHSMRMFVATGALLKLWNIVEARMGGQKKKCVRRVASCAATC